MRKIDMSPIANPKSKVDWRRGRESNPRIDSLPRIDLRNAGKKDDSEHCWTSPAVLHYRPRIFFIDRDARWKALSENPVINYAMKINPLVTHPVKTLIHADKAARRTRARKSDAAFAAALIVSGLLATSWSAVAQTIFLGAAGDVTVLGASTVTNTGPTVVVGNLALSPGSSVTGFPPGVVVNGTIHINDALANQAHNDAVTAFGVLA